MFPPSAPIKSCSYPAQAYAEATDKATATYKATYAG